MRMHTCLHLICALVKFPVTGGQVNPDDSRLDFDIEDASAVDKDKLTADLNALIAANHPVTDRWITDAELEANPQLVRTMAVKPPTGTGKVRLVVIGEGGSVDLQPCGGTHVKATGEIAGASSSPRSRRRASRTGASASRSRERLSSRSLASRNIRDPGSPLRLRRACRRAAEATPVATWFDKLTTRIRSKYGGGDNAGLATAYFQERNPWQTTQANGWSRPTGWHRIWTPLASSSSTAPCTSPPPSATPRPSTWPQHIPGALFFDIDDIADKSSPLPHMLPSAKLFASRMKNMGVGDGMHVVAYDSEGLYSAARVWWMFRAMGHQEVSVLNGGLKKWKAEGRTLEDGEPRRRSERHFTAMLNAELVRDVSDVKALIGSKAVQIVDARAAARFAGTVPEPRAGLRSGHIPGSRNVPFASLLNADGTLKPADELRALFAGAGVDPAKPVVASCGSGVTAGVVALALALLGRPNAAVYDGSWTEWGADPALEVRRVLRSRLVQPSRRRGADPTQSRSPLVLGGSESLDPTYETTSRGVRASAVQRLQNFVEAGEIGAPLGLIGGDLRQAVDDGAALLQQLACLARVADRLERADLVVADRQVALPAGVPGSRLASASAISSPRQ